MPPIVASFTGVGEAAAGVTGRSKRTAPGPAGRMRPAGPFWLHTSEVLPFAHFAFGFTTVRRCFLSTQPWILPSEPTRLVAANVTPPSATKSASSETTFANVSRFRHRSMIRDISRRRGTGQNVLLLRERRRIRSRGRPGLECSSRSRDPPRQLVAGPVPLNRVGVVGGAVSEDPAVHHEPGDHPEL